MLDKVLILSASVGAGHLRAAEALEKVFHEQKAAREVFHVDTLDYTNKVFRDLYSKAYIKLVNKTPELLGLFYDYLDKPGKMEKPRLAFNKFNSTPFIEMLQRHKPDFIVCTHFLPSEIISWLRSKRKLASRQAIVVTDFDVHAMWLCRHFERYFVALEETREHLRYLGVPREKISLTGIPIDPVFSMRKDKRQMRLKHGLDPDKTTILISAGGFGVGPIEKLMSSLFRLKSPAQIAAVCGRSEELKRGLERRAKSLPSGSPVSVRVLGFTREMDELMEASDLLVGKPGGLTTCEALAKGLVFAVVNPIPGQEERNSDHLLEEGVAIRCNNLPVLSYKIDRLLADPVKFEQMRLNSLRLARPRAAYDIVTEIARSA